MCRARREGAKYTSEDKDQLLKGLPREGFTKVLGNFDIVSVTFKQDGGWGSDIPTLGHWVVTLKAHPPKQRASTYAVHFGEFDGKIYEIELIAPK